MTLVELYSKEDCHLCEIARDVLLNIRERHPFEFKELKIHDGHEQYEQFKERFPVVFINKEFAFQYRVPEQQFIAKLLAIA